MTGALMCSGGGVNQISKLRMTVLYHATSLVTS
jgi:hypothetical protein